jgi:hypothetical protein
MFAVPCAIGGLCVLIFAVSLNDQRLDPANRRPWSLREFAATI